MLVCVACCRCCCNAIRLKVFSDCFSQICKFSSIKVRRMTFMAPFNQLCCVVCVCECTVACCVPIWKDPAANLSKIICISAMPGELHLYCWFAQQCWHWPVFLLRCKKSVEIAHKHENNMHSVSNTMSKCRFHSNLTTTYTIFDVEILNQIFEVILNWL